MLRKLLRGIGQAWLILGLTLLLLLGVDQLLRAVLPEPQAAAPLRPGAIAPHRERAEAVAADTWVADYWREHAAARHTEWRSWVYWRRLPYSGELVHVDAHGFRVTPRPAQPAHRTIWLFGGSTAWGTGNRDVGTLAAQLQQVYAERSPELGVRVLNFAESGYVSRQSLAAFQSALACRGPAADLAIFLDGANDVFASWQARRAGLPQNEDNRRLEFNSSRRFGAQLRAWVERLEGIGRLVATPPPALDQAAIDMLAQATAGHWARQAQQAQVIGALSDVPALTLWQPTAFDRASPRGDEAAIVDAAPAEHVRLQRATRAAVQSKLAALPFALDLSSAFDNDQRPFFFDFVHLSEAGQRVLAERIHARSVEILRERPARTSALEDCAERPLG